MCHDATVVRGEGPDEPQQPGSRRFRLRRGMRVFAAPADQARARRATDLLLLAGCLVGIVLVGWVSEPPAGFLKALADFLGALPSFLDGFWQLLLDGLALYAVVLVGATAWSRRWALVRDMVLALLLAVGIALVVARWVEGSWPDAWDAVRASAPPAWFPAQRIAAAGAVLAVASPHLALPFRRLGRWFLALAAVAVAVLGVSTPHGVVAGLLVAGVAAAAVHIALGSGAGRPGLEMVEGALRELGVHPHAVREATRQLAGVFVVSAEDDDGPLTVKVYGRDAYDTQLVSSVWRSVWYRSEEPSFTLSRLQHVEHEAFLTLLASQAGVLTTPVVTAGATNDGDALLVLRPRGVPLAQVEGGPAGRLAASLWSMLAVLHRAGISHGQIDALHVLVEGDQLGLGDFRTATVAPDPERFLRDQAQAFVTSVLAFGDELALSAAVDALGPARLAAVMPFVQLPALTRHQRAAVRAAGLDLDELRERVAAAADATPPELRQLRRVTWGSVLQTFMLVFVFAALVTAFTRLDLETLAEPFGDARWWLVVLAFFFAQVPRLTQSVSTLGASPIPLPLGPVYALQLAVSYVNLAVPSTAARVAVNVRFFQRHGLPPGAALGIGGLDGFSGFIVQMLLLGGLLLFSSASLDLDLDLDLSDTAGGILRAVLVIAVVAVVAAVALPRLRRRITTSVRQFARDATSALRGLRSPRRLSLLFGGNLATELLFAMTLGLFVHALGFRVGLGELLLINLSVALLAGLLPVPGGIGVAEGGLTLGLVAAGMPEEAAFAAVIMYRVSTFYVPPVWGFFAFRWLERNRHL